VIKLTTPDGFEADLLDGGDACLQVYCDELNRTHFGGTLPPITVSAVSRFKHPTSEVLFAITFKAEELPVFGLQTPWLILIHQDYCAMPLGVQYLLHEMTHVFLPDEVPFHSEKFWSTLREKWLIDLELMMGMVFASDETPSGLGKRLLEMTAFHRLLGL